MDASQADSDCLPITLAPEVKDLKLGVVVGRNVTIGPAPSSFTEWCARQTATVLQDGVAGGETRREAVRKMLRAGGFKPAGRNKPAQEYLLRTANQDGGLPAILNLVDALNVVSLRSGLPISLLAADRMGHGVVVRYGQPGESFVFNRSGQALDVEGLICVCTADGQPLGSPIKDSMLGKVTESDRNVVAFLYAPSSAITSDELAEWTHELAIAFQQLCPEATLREQMAGA